MQLTTEDFHHAYSIKLGIIIIIMFNNMDGKKKFKQNQRKIIRIESEKQKAVTIKQHYSIYRSDGQKAKHCCKGK